MEFFRIVKAQSSESKLQDLLTISNIENLSTLIFNIDEVKETESAIGGVWGEFTLCSQKIKGGVRFALKECPNALCWTITTGYPPARESVIVHLTINRTQKPPDFIEEIEAFLDDHASCLLSALC